MAGASAGGRRLKLLIDEMWTPEIAIRLRARGHDVEAVRERIDLATASDSVVFLTAQMEGRAIVTADIGDFRRIALQTFAAGGSHHGLLLAPESSIPRRVGRQVGPMVAILEPILRANRDLTDAEIWLRLPED